MFIQGQLNNFMNTLGITSYMIASRAYYQQYLRYQRTTKLGVDWAPNPMTLKPHITPYKSWLLRSWSLLDMVTQMLSSWILQKLVVVIDVVQESCGGKTSWVCSFRMIGEWCFMLLPFLMRPILTPILLKAIWVILIQTVLHSSSFIERAIKPIYFHHINAHAKVINHQYSPRA